jgi:hypothetical protein
MCIANFWKSRKKGPVRHRKALLHRRPDTNDAPVECQVPELAATALQSKIYFEAEESGDVDDGRVADPLHRRRFEVAAHRAILFFLMHDESG